VRSRSHGGPRLTRGWLTDQPKTDSARPTHRSQATASKWRATGREPTRTRGTIAPVSTFFDIITFRAFTVLLPFLPLGAWFGFVIPPPAYFGFLLVAVVGFLAAIEPVKRALYKRKLVTAV